MEISGDFTLNPLFLNNKDIFSSEILNKKDINSLYQLRNKKLNLDTYYTVNYVLQEIEKIVLDKEEALKLPIKTAIKMILDNLGSTWAMNKVIQQNFVIWELLESNNQLEQCSMTDTLTWIWNRRLINKSLREAIESKNRNNIITSILLIDIDHFKTINDTYWHDIWDKALIELSQLFNITFRMNDIIWRWWWEEFMIIMPWTGIKEAAVKADILRLLVEKLLFKKIDKIEKNITISTWVAQINESDEIPDTIMKRADLALYEAKHNWRNCVKIEAISEDK